MIKQQHWLNAWDLNDVLWGVWNRIRLVRWNFEYFDEELSPTKIAITSRLPGITSGSEIISATIATIIGKSTWIIVTWWTPVSRTIIPSPTGSAIAVTIVILASSFFIECLYWGRRSWSFRFRIMRPVWIRKVVVEKDSFRPLSVYLCLVLAEQMLSNELRTFEFLS